MLKTTRFSLRILALGYSVLIWFGFSHSAFCASRNHAFSCCSQSSCFSQKSLNIFLEITLKPFFFQRYKIFTILGIFCFLETYQKANHSNFIVLLRQIHTNWSVICLFFLVSSCDNKGACSLVIFVLPQFLSPPPSIHTTHKPFGRFLFPTLLNLLLVLFWLKFD